MCVSEGLRVAVELRLGSHTLHHTSGHCSTAAVADADDYHSMEHETCGEFLLKTKDWVEVGCASLSEPFGAAEGGMIAAVSLGTARQLGSVAPCFLHSLRSRPQEKML